MGSFPFTFHAGTYFLLGVAIAFSRTRTIRTLRKWTLNSNVLLIEIDSFCFCRIKTILRNKPSIALVWLPSCLGKISAEPPKQFGECLTLEAVGPPAPGLCCWACASLAEYKFASSWPLAIFFLNRIRLLPNQFDTCFVQIYTKHWKTFFMILVTSKAFGFWFWADMCCWYFKRDFPF